MQTIRATWEMLKEPFSHAEPIVLAWLILMAIFLTFAPFIYVRSLLRKRRKARRHPSNRLLD